MYSTSTAAALAIAAGAALMPAHASASTTYDTSGVGCSYAEKRSNTSLGMTSTASWSCAKGTRSLTANGIPDHSIGTFPNSGNPNTITTQQISQSFTTSPVYTGKQTKISIFGYALNGVKFDPATAQTCTANCSNGGADGTGSWHIEALGQNYFYLGVDYNNAHVQPNGWYHYHGMPNGVLGQIGFQLPGYTGSDTNVGDAGAYGNTGSVMTLVGWAVDGFPIYARYGYKVATVPGSGLKVLNSSWRIKAAPDTGRPSTSIAPAGTFTEDYEYVKGQGDLDACNGRTGVTPEFPKGIYYYVITDTFPFAPRCVYGSYMQMPPPPPPPSAN